MANGKSDLEELFLFMLRKYLKKNKIDDITFVREFRFGADYVGLGPGIKNRLIAAEVTDSRFDFAFLDNMVGVEIHGGEWIKGGHVTGVGFNRDRRKMNQALRLGWKVLEFTGTMLKREPKRCMSDLAILMGWETL